MVFPVSESGRTVLIHGSTGPDPTGLGVNVAPRVGRGGKVVVAFGVFVRVAVGEGSDVEVGMAAWVCATIVYAAATAVTCRSTGSTAGVACGTIRALQALTINANTSIWMGSEKRFK